MPYIYYMISIEYAIGLHMTIPLISLHARVLQSFQQPTF